MRGARGPAGTLKSPLPQGPRSSGLTLLPTRGKSLSGSPPAGGATRPSWGLLKAKIWVPGWCREVGSWHESPSGRAGTTDRGLPRVPC